MMLKQDWENRREQLFRVRRLPSRRFFSDALRTRRQFGLQFSQKFKARRQSFMQPCGPQSTRRIVGEGSAAPNLARGINNGVEYRFGRSRGGRLRASCL